VGLVGGDERCGVRVLFAGRAACFKDWGVGKWADRCRVEGKYPEFNPGEGAPSLHVQHITLPGLQAPAAVGMNSRCSCCLRAACCQKSGRAARPRSGRLVPHSHT
jgi:hypothetical protein